jgi:hypothetical protein
VAGSTLKEVPKTETLLEEIKEDLRKRAELKASRTLLKETVAEAVTEVAKVRRCSHSV